MADHILIGKEGEEIAKKHLIENGYTIIKTNWRHRYNKAEIDIIAKFNNTIIIVEVKTRSSNTIEEPEEAVNYKKQKLLLKIADLYAQENNVQEEFRFDIISVLKVGNQWKINHIEDAFSDCF